MNTNYQQEIAGAALAKCSHWEQLNGIAGSEYFDGWVLYGRKNGVWIQRSHIPISDAKKYFNSAEKLHKKYREAEKDLNKLNENVEIATRELIGKAKAVETAKDNLKELEKAVRERSQKLEETKAAIEPAKQKLEETKKAFTLAYIAIRELLIKNGIELQQELDEKSVQSLAGKYKTEGIEPRALQSDNGDWVIIYLGEGIVDQYLITWGIEAFTSPLRERSLLDLDSLIGYLLSLSQIGLDALLKKVSNAANTKNEQTMKQNLLETLTELVKRIQHWASPNSEVHRRKSEELRPITPGSLDFMKDALANIGIQDDPITHETIRTLTSKPAEVEAAAKSWETGDIFKLWRLLPRRAAPDMMREALARILAERITKNSEGREDVVAFLENYQAFMDQNGMDKTSPHPLYYMILSRKSRGALKTLVDACEDDTLLGCSAWSVDKGAYEPRVWQALLDGLTDRLTLKFHRDIYDADAFDQMKRIVMNVKEIIGVVDIPDQLRQPYQWRLVSLLREAISHAENALEDGSTETGGADTFIKWAEDDFLPGLEFLKEYPQMNAMFEKPEKEPS